jgi:RNA polymerase sigma-70 factor (ECF subfamily)
MEDAQDLTQSFFAKLLESETIAKSDPHRGRFRSFLLSSLKNFLADEWDKAHAAKRGGARPTRALLPGGIDADTAEAWYGREPATDITPEKLFDRRWALTLLGSVLETLRKRYEADGKAGLFDRLKPFIGGGGNNGNSLPSSGIATDLGMTDAAVKVAIHRLRRRYRECLRSAIADTVESEADIDDEIRDLFAAVGR